MSEWDGVERRSKPYERRKAPFTVVWKLSVTGTILVVLAILGYAINYGHNLVTQQDLKEQMSPVNVKLDQLQESIAFIKGQLEEQKELQQKRNQ